MKIQRCYLKSSRLSVVLLIMLLSILLHFVGYVSASPYTTWSLPEGAKARLNKGGASKVVYSPDGTLLAVASNVGIWLYDAQTGEERNLLARPNESVRNILFSPDGQTLVSYSHGRITRLWDVQSGHLLSTLRGPRDRISSMAFSPDGQTLATGSEDRTIHLWDIKSGRFLRTFTDYSQRSFGGISFSPDGQTLAANDDEIIRLWDIKGKRPQRKLTEHTEWITSMAFSPDGQTLASGSRDTNSLSQLV